MARYGRGRITVERIESLALGEMLMDTDEPGLGIRRQGDARVFFVRRYRDGRRHFVTIGTHGEGGLTVTTARERAKRLVASILDGHDPSAARAVERGMPTVSDLAAEWLELHVDAKLKSSTAKAYRSALRVVILPSIGDLRVNRVTADAVQRLHHKAMATPYVANRSLAIISKMFGYAERAGYRKPGSNPARGIERFREERRERYLTDDELGRLGGALAAEHVVIRHTPYAIAAIKLLAFTGMRLNEVLTLRWDEVDIERRLLFLADSKTGRKTVIAGSAAIELLRGLPRSSSQYVFPGARTGRPLEGVRKAWKNVTKEADLFGVRIHDLRHTFASISASAGGSLLMIGKLLGHSQHQTTARYAHLATDPIRDLADKTSLSISKALLGHRIRGCNDA